MVQIEISSNHNHRGSGGVATRKTIYTGKIFLKSSQEPLDQKRSILYT
jgi:hypothetical protein